MARSIELENPRRPSSAGRIRGAPRPVRTAHHETERSGELVGAIAALVKAVRDRSHALFGRGGVERVDAEAIWPERSLRAVADAGLMGLHVPRLTRVHSPLLGAKIAAATAAVQVTNGALDLGGGRAYRENGRLTRLLRDARAGHVMAPTTELLKVWLGRSLLDLPLL